MGLQDEWNGLEIEKNLPKGRGSFHHFGRSSVCGRPVPSLHFSPEAAPQVG
jgi:hypothetical protein